MAKRIVICFWLMVAIVCQSFYAVADSTADIAIAIEHLDGEHMQNHTHLQNSGHGKTSVKHHFASVAESTGTSTPDSEFDQHDHSDCHHCGHCSTPHVIWDINHALPSVIAQSDADFFVRQLALQDFADNTYRPPIV
ncbi:hypothetical protein HR060_10000 [Catenovulum sp. SM1970]|uniref:hypothetical protein n=1 Tax=Marinifaba aquimaris TaxID=2741323 RepID=UPI001571E9A4|nr:hypothetical protein [Marinifaba aquimaris]NTS77195.1 hypothetical protein [Marinifaba aquimaris]